MWAGLGTKWQGAWGQGKLQSINRYRAVIRKNWQEPAGRKPGSKPRQQSHFFFLKGKTLAFSVGFYPRTSGGRGAGQRGREKVGREEMLLLNYLNLYK
jgi:hypothetical protein